MGGYTLTITDKWLHTMKGHLAIFMIYARMHQFILTPGWCKHGVLIVIYPLCITKIV